MRAAQEAVRRFLEKHARPIATLPRLIGDGDAEHRHDLAMEELREYLESVHAGDLAGVADALADQLFVLLGTACTHGIDLQPVFEEVCRSNMTKTPLDPLTKKGGKGPGYEHPRIAALLLQQLVGPLPPVGDDTCMTCGHPKELHAGMAIIDDVLCGYHDSEGPCLCGEYVPCDHIPRSQSSRHGQLGRTCCCGRVWTTGGAVCL